MRVELTKEELITIQEGLTAYYKIRAFNWLPYFEKCEARESINNYYEKQNLLDEIVQKIDNYLEIINEAENS